MGRCIVDGGELYIYCTFVIYLCVIIYVVVHCYITVYDIHKKSRLITTLLTNTGPAAPNTPETSPLVYHSMWKGSYSSNMWGARPICPPGFPQVACGDASSTCAAEKEAGMRYGVVRCQMLINYSFLSSLLRTTILCISASLVQGSSVTQPAASPSQPRYQDRSIQVRLISHSTLIYSPHPLTVYALYCNMYA